MIFIDFITKNKNGQLKNYKKLYLAFYVKNVAIFDCFVLVFKRVCIYFKKEKRGRKNEKSEKRGQIYLLFSRE